MKEFLINFAKDKFQRPYFEINPHNGDLEFKLKNKVPFSKNFLLVKHRRSGKRISIPIKNSKAILTKEKLKRIEEFGVFDIFLKIYLFNQSEVYRIKFKNHNIGKFLFDDENDFYFETYPSFHGNLSAALVESKFHHDLYSIEAFENGISIKGFVNISKDTEFDEILLIGYSHKGHRKEFSCEFEGDYSKVLFKSDIIFDFDESKINTSWHFGIELKNKGFIVDKSSVKCYGLSDYESHKDTLFAKVNVNNLDENYLKDNFEPDEMEDNKPCIFYFSNYRFIFKSNFVPQFKYDALVQRNKRKDWYDKYKDIPIENDMIFFESFHGRYTNNPKYIYEKMLEMGLDKKYKMVWSYDGDDVIPGNPIIVDSDGEEYYKYLCCAKYKVSNATFPIIDGRREKIFLQTWHGTPLKRLGKDIHVSNPGIRWGHFNKEVPTWNYLVSANEFSSETFQRAFLFKNDVLEYGYPANDIFYRDNDDLIVDIKNKLNIDMDKKIILYAPTFRDDKKDENGNRFFDLELDLNKFYENLKDEYVLIIKTHSVVTENLDLDEKFSEFVVDCSDYDDIHELFIISDILITDYSSVFFDFAHSKRPILFFTPDMKNYIKSRGVYHEILEELPGPQLIDNDEIINAIQDIDNVSKQYDDQYKKFYEKYCSIGHGNASELIIKKVFKG